MTNEEVDLWQGYSRQPYWMATGGEHQITMLGGGLVAKVSEHLLRLSIQGRLTDEKLETIALDRRHQYAGLQDVFGPEHVLTEACDVHPVLLTTKDCQRYVPEYSDSDPDRYHKFGTLLVQQQTLPALELLSYNISNSPRIIGMGDNTYAEERITAQQLPQYEQASDFLILGKGESPQSLHSYAPAPWLPRTWESLRGGWHWRSPAMQQMAQGFTEFQARTEQQGGKVLDITGGYNIAFLPGRDPEQNDFKVVDVIYPYPGLTLEEIGIIMAALNEPDPRELSNAERGKLLNGTNYLRAVNSIIWYSEIGNELMIRPFADLVEWRDDIWQRVFTETHAFLQALGR